MKRIVCLVLAFFFLLCLPAFAQSSDSGTKYEYSVDTAGDGEGGLATATSASVHVDYDISESGVTTGPSGGDVLVFSGDGTVEWIPYTDQSYYYSHLSHWSEETQYYIHSALGSCPKNKIRVDGKCVPRTCENGGLGEQDCKQDPEPCAEGFVRGEDGNCYPIPEPPQPCPEGFERGEDGNCYPIPEPPKPCPDGFERDASGNCVQQEQDCPDGFVSAGGGLCVEIPEEPEEPKEPVDPNGDFECFPLCELEETVFLRHRFTVWGETTAIDGTVSDMLFKNTPPHGTKRVTALSARFNCDNVTGMVRVRDACGVNGHYWVDWSSLDVGPHAKVWVYDHLTEEVWTAEKGFGENLLSITDKEAFDCSP